MPTPWLAASAWRYVRGFLKPNHLVFEWGSGQSTMAIAQICKIISIENDLKWYKKLATNMPKNAKLIYVPHKGMIERDASDPDSYASGSKLFRGCNFTNYVKYIDSTDSTYDVILIDGRARPSCVKHAIPRLKNGGLLIVDDYMRARYQKAISIIPTRWKAQKYNGGHHTAIWVAA